MAEEEKGMLSKVLGFLNPFAGDDDEEELSNEQLFMNHYNDFGTLLTDDEGNPTLNFSDSLLLYPENTREHRMNRQNLNYLYEMGNFPSEYRQ